MPDVVQATSQGDALQTSVWVTSVGNGFKTKSRIPGLAEKDFKGVMS